MRNLLTLGGFGLYCCIGALVERATPTATAPVVTDTYIISLCNAIGVTIESKYVPFQPSHICVTQSYAIIAAKSLFYIWGIGGFTGSQMVKKQPFERYVETKRSSSIVRNRSYLDSFKSMIQQRFDMEMNYN